MKKKAAEPSEEVITWLFPIGLMDRIREYAKGWKSMRQVATEFERYGVTREMLMDIDNGIDKFEEADVKKVRRKRSK